MRKIQLDLAELQVDSFDTVSVLPSTIGTVQAKSEEDFDTGNTKCNCFSGMMSDCCNPAPPKLAISAAATCIWSCAHNTCNSCAYSCGFECGLALSQFYTCDGWGSCPPNCA